MRNRMDLQHNARTGRDARDSGFSIVEIVIAIVLMGTVVIAVLNAVTTSVKASSVSRSAAQVETAVVNAADRVNRAPKRCDYTIYVQAAVQTEGWPADTATVTQEYYVPGPDATVEGTWATGAGWFARLFRTRSGRPARAAGHDFDHKPRRRASVATLRW